MRKTPLAKTPTTSRLLFVDSLRFAMIVLVVYIHAAVTYSGLGSWYYKEAAPLGPWSYLFFLYFQTFVQSFFMGLLFFLAGYFVPGSCARKGPARFTWDRLTRLGLPSLLYALLIQPLNWSLLQGKSLSLQGAYAHYKAYLVELRFIGGTGPMWFAVALLLFSMLYAAAASVWGPPFRAMSGDLAGRLRPIRPAMRHVAGLGAVLALATFAVRLVYPIGTSVLNMQLCYFAQYVVFFLLGLVASKQDWLERFSTSLAQKCLYLAAGALLFISWLFWAGGAAGSEVAPFLGGWHWQAAGFALWESLNAVSVSLWLLVRFRERFNSPSAGLQPYIGSSFAVYVLHAPVLIGLSLLCREIALPAVAKWALVGSLAVVLSFAVARLLVRVPVLGRLLRG